MLLRSCVVSAALATAAAGCYSDQPDVAYPTTAYGSPSLVEVSPGVSVIADYDYPVFYSDGWWWRYDGGLWYRSGYYRGGWGLAYSVPIGVRGIHNPYGYTHWRGGRVVDHHGSYRGGAGWRANTGYRGGYANGGYRSYRGGYRNAPAVRPSPGQMSRPTPQASRPGPTTRPMARGSVRSSGGVRVGGWRGGGGGHRR